MTSDPRTRSVSEQVDLDGGASSLGFFEDPQALADLVRAVRDYATSNPERTGFLRIWVPGCGTGEEAFTVAAVVDRALCTTEIDRDFLVFATDARADAVRTGAAGHYPTSAFQAIPQNERDICANASADDFTIVQRLRSKVLFRRHDLIGDVPLPRADVVCCRALLRNLTSSDRAAAFANLLDSLRPGGLLFLGAGNGFDELPPAFRLIDAAHHLYRRSEAADAVRPGTRSPPPAPSPSPSPSPWAAACAALPTPMLVLDHRNAIVAHNPAFADAFPAGEDWLDCFDDDGRERLQRSLDVVRMHRGSTRCQANGDVDTAAGRWNVELAAVPGEAAAVAIVMTNGTATEPRTAAAGAAAHAPTSIPRPDKQVLLPYPDRPPAARCGEGARTIERAAGDDHRARRHARDESVRSRPAGPTRPLRERLHDIRTIGQALARSGFDGRHRARQTLLAFDPDQAATTHTG